MHWHKRITLYQYLAPRNKDVRKTALSMAEAPQLYAQRLEQLDAEVRLKRNTHGDAEMFGSVILQ